MPSETSTGTEWWGAVAQADLVRYQPGAVVSRSLVKKATGTVTAFAFDAGEGIFNTKVRAFWRRYEKSRGKRPAFPLRAI
jgi:hypothetical protein